ncbi:F0F1 ATP synthase subunit B' [Telmatospirillum sp. J64-1]|uniref:F0F1 ATP synthase subunit B family protein n=1 Tax=Telmatospirillum sp. J64-1 TaxID=2502183 RepID=UPI00115F75A7|nr:F0F1 ATP synthase subunit B' [Telmatospirillum sp. J64-1]
MPQFDPTFFAPQLVWLAITFTLLYLLMSTVALPRIGEVLEERQRKIQDNLDKALALKTEAEAAIASYEKALAESRAKAQEMLRETQDRLSKQAEQRQKEVSARLAEQIQAGEVRIQAVKEQAMASVRDVALEIAEATAQRLTGQAPARASLDAAVAGAMKE